MTIVTRHRQADKKMKDWPWGTVGVTLGVAEERWGGRTSVSFAIISTCCRSAEIAALVGPEARYPTTLTPLVWWVLLQEGLRKRGPDLGPGTARTGFHGRSRNEASPEPTLVAHTVAGCMSRGRCRLPVPGPLSCLRELIHGVEIQSRVCLLSIGVAFGRSWRRKGADRFSSLGGAVSSIMFALCNGF